MSITGWLGGPTRSLATVLAHLDGRVRRTLAAPAKGDFIPVVERRRLVEEHLVIPRGGRARGYDRALAALRILRWARRHRAELTAIHANGLAEMSVAALAAFVCRTRLVVWVHASEPSPWTRRLAPLWGGLLRTVRWVAVSTTAADVVDEIGLTTSAGVGLVPNPIDPAEFRAEGRVAHAGFVVIGFFGHDTHSKGFHLLPDIFARLVDLPVRFVLFGSTPEQANDGFGEIWRRLEALPPGRLELPGRQQDMRPAYGRCDVVLCPSLQESFCRVAAEAMLNGVPVAASDLPPLRGLLGDDEAGLLFPPGDVDRAADSLRRLVTDPELRERLGRHGRERAAAFMPDVVVRALLNSYGIAPDGLQ